MNNCQCITAEHSEEGLNTCIENWYLNNSFASLFKLKVSLNLIYFWQARSFQNLTPRFAPLSACVSLISVAKRNRRLVTAAPPPVHAADVHRVFSGEHHRMRRRRSTQSMSHLQQSWTLTCRRTLSSSALCTCTEPKNALSSAHIKEPRQRLRKSSFLSNKITYNSPFCWMFLTAGHWLPFISEGCRSVLTFTVTDYSVEFNF